MYKSQKESPFSPSLHPFPFLTSIPPTRCYIAVADCSFEMPTALPRKQEQEQDLVEKDVLV